VRGYGVSDDDMPNFPWPGRGAASGIDDAALAALLSGTHVPEDVPAALQPAADVLAALRARPSTDEVSGLTAAVAEFRERVGVSDPSRQSRRRRPSVLTSLVSAKVAAAAAAAVIVVGGMATAAFAGVLPSTAQGIAHDWIGAPAAHSSHSSGSAAGKSATRATSATARHRRHHHHFRRFDCYVAVPHPSGSPSAHPSWSPSPRPSWSPSPRPSASGTHAPRPICAAPPAATHKPRPHKPRPHHKPLPRRHFKPHPLPSRPTPSVSPTPMPSA
jgi:hypothetical protein